MKDDTYICDNKKPKFGKESSVYSCEIYLLNNKTTPRCRLTRLQGDLAWIQMNHKNHWIYATTADIELSAVCGTRITTLTLMGSGILTMEPNCVIKGNVVTIQGHYISSSNIHTSYATFKNIMTISTPVEINRVFNTTYTQFETQLEQLSALHNRLSQETFTNLPDLMDATSQHHHAVSYTALIFSVALIISIATWHWNSKRNLATITTPHPRPRQTVDESSFTVKI